MRFYGFGNYYLSSLQQGLQAGHAAVELFVDYIPVGLEERFLNEAALSLIDWSKNHKTMVLLNGGNSADLQELYDFLNTPDNPYAFVKFHEDDISLNGALTYVGTILPSLIYDTAAKMRQTRNYEYDTARNRVIFSSGVSSNSDLLLIEEVEMTPFQFDLCERLNQYGLAK